MGPGMTEGGHPFTKTSNIRNYVREKLANLDTEKWKSDFNKYKDFDYTRVFTSADRRIPLPSNEEIDKVMEKMGKYSAQDQLNCGACGYDTCIDHAIAIHVSLPVHHGRTCRINARAVNRHPRAADARPRNPRSPP